MFCLWYSKEARRKMGNIKKDPHNDQTYDRGEIDENVPKLGKCAILERFCPGPTGPVWVLEECKLVENSPDITRTARVCVMVPGNTQIGGTLHYGL